MLFPIRCFSCGAPIGHLWEKYNKMVKSNMSPAKALDTLGIKRYCCRRMFLSHVEVIDTFLEFSVSSSGGSK